jgi:NodT family efflux transporter outer membrane factor (OMF) lipoprotein
MRRQTRKLWAVTAMCLLFMAGCTVGPDFVRPKPPAVERYTTGAQPVATVSAEGQAQYFKEGVKISAEWWQLFNSPKLDDMIRQAMDHNPTLQAAQAGLRRSQDLLRAGYGVFYPQVDAGFDATRQKLSQARFGGSATSSSIFNLYTLSANVSYALDVFGAERRTVEGLEAQVDFQRFTVEGTYLTLTGNIVNTVIARAAYIEEIRATEQIIDTLKEQVRITEVQAQAGTVPYSNVLSIQSQLAGTEATLPPLRQKLSQAGHLLAVLTGRTPDEGAPPQIDLADIKLPGDLPITLPSELVHQRPDILAAEAELHSSSADIGVATAALYPSITLTGSYGVENTSFGNLFKDSGIWSLGGDILAPIFHGGSLKYRKEAAIEAYNQSFAVYRQTVLSAFAQVADTLRALEHDAEALSAQSRALNAADEALRLVQVNYRAGTVNFLQVLTADNLYYQAKTGYLQAKAQRIQDTVGLFVALGGRWDADPKSSVCSRNCKPSQD